MFDSIRYDLKRSRSFFLSLDGKNSFVSDLPIKMFGLQAGYLYNRRTNFYVGYYASYNNTDRVIILENPTATKATNNRDSNTVFKTYELAYFNFGCEYYFHNSRKWRFSIPAGIGLGLGGSKIYTDRKILSNKVSGIIPIEVGFNANYKITWWLWAGAGIGTRVSLITSHYNGPFYTIGLSIKFTEIYRRGMKLIRKKH